MPPPPRPAHGLFSLSWKGEVLYIEVFGIVNVEAIEAYFLQLKETVAKKGLERWGRLVDLRQWEGFTPEAKEGYNTIAKWYTSAGAVAHVQIYPSNFFRDLAAGINVSVSNTAPVLQCQTVQEGLDWLGTFGLATN